MPSDFVKGCVAGLAVPVAVYLIMRPLVSAHLKRLIQEAAEQGAHEAREGVKSSMDSMLELVEAKLAEGVETGRRAQAESVAETLQEVLEPMRASLNVQLDAASARLRQETTQCLTEYRSAVMSAVQQVTCRASRDANPPAVAPAYFFSFALTCRSNLCPCCRRRARPTGRCSAVRRR